MMTKILCLILFSYACLNAQEQTVEPLPEIPDKTSKHKTISDVITSKNILRIISIKSPFSKTEKLFLTSELRITSNNYRSKTNEVVQSLYTKSKEYELMPSLFNKSKEHETVSLQSKEVTNDILVITKDKVWRVIVYETANLPTPILCIVTDGNARYDYVLPYINNKKENNSRHRIPTNAAPK